MSDNDDIILPLGSGSGMESSGDTATTAPGGMPSGIQGLATSATAKAVGAIPQAAPATAPGSHAGLVGSSCTGYRDWERSVVPLQLVDVKVA